MQNQEKQQETPVAVTPQAEQAQVELTEQELLEEFGVLMAVEYGYQAM